jgi:flagellar L-ring protein FlgH
MMNVRSREILVLCLASATGCWWVQAASAQTSSLYLEAAKTIGSQDRQDLEAGLETRKRDGANKTIEESSLIAVKLPPPRKFRTHDVITIIVREQKKYKSEADLEQEKKWDIDAKLEDWFRFYPRHRLGTDQLPNGKPGIKGKWDTKLENDGETQRKDDLSLRIAAEVIDVKPNGQLVMEAKKRIKNDEEVQNVTLTGICRGADVTADNTVLSTQLVDLDIAIEHTGAMRDASRRGWIPRLLDFVRPF